MSAANDIQARKIPRAEHIGSLLRPPAVRDALNAVFRSPEISRLEEVRERALDDLNHVADEAITDAIGRQESSGLDSVTDGEFRRAVFVNSFYDAIGGLGEPTAPVNFRNAD